MRLADEVARRLALAGIGPDDPGMVALAKWNQGARDRQIVHVELRRGQFGQTRRVRLADIERGESDGTVQGV
jgi:hypothetical protein